MFDAEHGAQWIAGSATIVEQAAVMNSITAVATISGSLSWMIRAALADTCNS